MNEEISFVRALAGLALFALLHLSGCVTTSRALSKAKKVGETVGKCALVNLPAYVRDVKDCYQNTRALQAPVRNANTSKKDEKK